MTSRGIARLVACLIATLHIGAIATGPAATIVAQAHVATPAAPPVRPARQYTIAQFLDTTSSPP